MLYKQFDSLVTVLAIQIRRLFGFCISKHFQFTQHYTKQKWELGGKKKVKGEERELGIASRSLQCTQ